MISFPKRTSSRARLAVFALLVYGLMVAISVACLVVRRDALAFHNRDYNYFIEQAARLSDPLMSKRYALNIEGFNFIGLQGIEGERSLVQAIHTEYFRYTYTILYGLFQSTLLIYVFYSLLFFSPLLYLALVPRPRQRFDGLPAALFILLFVLFPATMPAVTNDLRSRMLFNAAWPLVVLAIYFERPFLEKLLLFGFLLAIREEGIVLGLIVIILNAVRVPDPRKRRQQTLILLALDGLAAVLFVTFMAWGRYTRVDAGMNPLQFVPELLATQPALVIVLALVALALAIALLLTWQKQRAQFNRLIMLLAYAAALGITGVPVLKDVILWPRETGTTGLLENYYHAVTNPNTTLFFYMAILLLVLLFETTRGRARSLFAGGLVALAVLFATTSLATFPPQVKAWRQNIPAARLVWQFVNSHDRYQTPVLLDFATYQAFFHFDQVLVYNRLPMWLVNPVPENRFYPQNKDLVVRQIEERMQYAVISRESLPVVSEMARLAGAPAQEIAGNERYVILRLR